MGAESPDDYNERAARVAEHLAVQLPGSFAIVDEGRSPDECAVVVVENGHYQGFGYLDLSEAASTEALRDCIRPQQSNPEVLRIIRLFLRKNPTVKKIPLEGF